MGSSTLLIVLAVMLTSGRSLPSVGVGGRTWQTSIPSAGNERIDYESEVEERYFDQRLDHFDRTERREFRQRYFVNRRYWSGAESGAPVFLCVGGEGPPLTAAVLSQSVHCNDMVELAPKHQALLLAVEHRYYGKSSPFEEWTTESLRWLSSQQALSDLASFRGFITSREGLRGNEKWVTWGGSYPGMLAGWARLKFPHLFHSAVSSSSPMLAQLDFPQYAEMMRYSLTATDDGVGGSEACASAVEVGHAKIGHMMQSQEGRYKLVDKFALCEKTALDTHEARVIFAGDGVVTLPIQENDPACDEPLCNIEDICEVMLDEDLGCEVSRLAVLRAAQRNASEPRGVDAAAPCEVLPPQEYSPRSLAPPYPANPGIAWLYQTCTEFGFYQTCEKGTRCPFTQGLHTLELDLDMCTGLFNISAKEVEEQVYLTNVYYGGDQPSGSRVIFPNGEIDPWHALGVLKAPSPDLPVVYVKGASHHFWTHPSRSTDSVDVVAARNTIWHQVTTWLGEDDETDQSFVGVLEMTSTGGNLRGTTQ